MTDHWERVGCGNLPESLKPGLLPGVARGRAALKLIDEAGISLFAAQESGTNLMAACREHDDFNYVRATPNENHHGRERGNLLVFNRHVWHVAQKQDLTVNIPAGRPPRLSKTETRPIHQGRFLLTHIPSGRWIRVWSVHKPRDIKGYQHARGYLDGRLDGAAEYWSDHDLLALLMGDFNGAPPQLLGMRRRASSGPDNIVASTQIDWRGVQYHPLRKISDHRNAVSIELNIPARTKEPQ